MYIFRSFKISKEFLNSTLAIGNFDGVHLGHRRVIEKAIKISKKNKSRIGILTFEPHPKCFFKKKYDFFRLTPLNQKLEIFRDMGVDFVVNIKFNETFYKKTALDFIKRNLVGDLKVNSVVTGFDFVFGNKKVGNVDLISNYAKKTEEFNFFEVKEVKKNKNLIISSSVIRNYLRAGKIKEANRLLSREWSITGKVIEGEKKAREFGFKTANIKMNDFCNIQKGVYAVRIKLSEKHKKKNFLGIANFGVKPTFNKVEPLLEVHLFNFNSNLYNENLTIVFYEFIRPEKKFQSIEKLKDQIIKDIKQVKNVRLLKNH